MPLCKAFQQPCSADPAKAVLHASFGLLSAHFLGSRIFASAIQLRLSSMVLSSSFEDLRGPEPCPGAFGSPGKLPEAVARLREVYKCHTVYRAHRAWSKALPVRSLLLNPSAVLLVRQQYGVRRKLWTGEP